MEIAVVKLTSPLFTGWSPQYAKLVIPKLEVGLAASLEIDGKPGSFQYTGAARDGGAEVMVRLSFERDQTRTLRFRSASNSTTDLRRVDMPLRQATAIGPDGHAIKVPASSSSGTDIPGPLAAVSSFPIESRVRCESPLASRTLTRVNDGPLFTDYELRYAFKDELLRYIVHYRCYRDEPIVEISEDFQLGMGGELEMAFNPQRELDSILSHRGPEFEGEPQPVIEPIDRARPRDVLCRLQMPVLTEYFIPNNRGWFAFFDSRNEKRGMFGILGLYGARWTRPVDNMPVVSVAEGRAVWRSSLDQGQRFWLIHTGPVERKFTTESLFIFHRLHAQFNALRLDEHLDLDGSQVLDASCWNKPGFFEDDYRDRARAAAASCAPLKKYFVESPLDLNGPTPPHVYVIQSHAIVEDNDKIRAALRDEMLARFEKWVRDFMGVREGKHDYGKNVIGFSRRMRDLLISYELLRRDGFLDDATVRKLNAYFVFAARRIMDEGRWPHSRSWLHPYHPESTRDIYTYTGEHKPDRLVWTNCLPNFQSDPMCALAHLSAIIPDHPDAPRWQRFALDDIDRQLDAYCGPNGAWEESINYALFTFQYFLVTFRALKNRAGINYFRDERVRRMAGWLARFLGPRDKRVGVYTFPMIGNSFLPSFCPDFLAYAAELEPSDPLRADVLGAYQLMEPDTGLGSHSMALMMAAAVPSLNDRPVPLRVLPSEHMAELGVAMRDRHTKPDESYLFQKIGFWKDHYEDDETSFNWFAKGTPMCMDYGTYTHDASMPAAHNMVEIPDSDSLTRGYLAEKFFSDAVDYTRCEVPVTRKLSYGKPSTFAEVDGPPREMLYFYLGDQNPVGSKTWKSRMLLFVKPDYIVIFDRIRGGVAHRFNCHAVAAPGRRDGSRIDMRGRYDLDLVCHVQHPRDFRFETAELEPGPERFGRGEKNYHRQGFFRLYNLTDGMYRTVLFARERDANVSIENIGERGVKITTPKYVDYAFLHDAMIEERLGDVEFVGRAGWIRREASGRILAAMPDGDRIKAFGTELVGRGPWSYDSSSGVKIEGTPRTVKVDIKRR